MEWLAFWSSDDCSGTVSRLLVLAEILLPATHKLLREEVVLFDGRAGMEGSGFSDMERLKFCARGFLPSPLYTDWAWWKEEGNCRDKL